MANTIGRPSKYKEEYCEQAEKLARLGATDKEMADVGEWVVLDGSSKILSHDQFMALYEEASGEEYIERRAK